MKGGSHLIFTLYGFGTESVTGINGFSLNGAGLALNSANSGNLINH